MAEALLSVVLDRLLSLAHQQIHDQVSLVVGVEKEIESLKRTLKSVRAVVADAEKRQVKEELVRIWLENLKDIAYHMDEVLDEWSTALLKYHIERAESSSMPDKKSVSSCLPIPCICFKRVYERRDIALKIKHIKQQLEDIANERNQFNFTPISIQEPHRFITISEVDISEVFGRNEDKDSILRQLLGQTLEQNLGPYTISVVGMGGMGKTTLAQLVFNHNVVKAHFEKRIWICVSDPFVPIRILRAILEALTEKSSHLQDPEALQQQIQKCIGGKKFLLVLDDVWTEDYQLWEQLRNCLKRGSGGSRILVTTRNKRVAMMMSSYMHPLGSLPLEKCRELFSQVAFWGKSSEKIEELQEVGNKIADKCKGLPLAVKALGSLMQSKDDKQDWEDVLNSEMWELDIFEKKLSPALLLSYYDLHPTLKQCFSYCAVFPKDHSIIIDHLIKLWMAQGYLNSKANGEMERLGKEYFENLAARSFFQEFEKDKEGKIIRCKMHDIVHDFAQFLTHNECLILYDENENLKTNFTIQNGRHATLIVHGTSTFSFPIQNASNLHTLLIVYGTFAHKFLPKPLQQFKYIRAIDLSGNKSIEELPEEVGALVYLRYLNVSFCRNLKTLPDTICCLHNLQTLDVSACILLTQLPQGMGNLVNLRHLVNVGAGVLGGGMSILPKGVARLTSLRTLSTFIVGDKCKINACKIEDLGNLKELRGEIEIKGLNMVEDVGKVEKADLKNRKLLLDLTLNFNIRRTERVVEIQKEVGEALQPHPDLKSLRLVGYGASEWPWWMMNSSILHQLRDLTLSSCGYCECLPPLGELPLLESIEIVGMQRLKNLGAEFLGSSSATKFPKLKHLSFEEMVEWENWELKTAAAEEEERQVMPCLVSLLVRSCPKLNALPDLLLQRTPALKLTLVPSSPARGRERFRMKRQSGSNTR